MSNYDNERPGPLDGFLHTPDEEYQGTEEEPIPSVNQDGDRGTHAIATSIVVAAAAVIDIFFFIAAYVNPGLKTIGILVLVILGTFLAAMRFARGSVSKAEAVIDIKATKPNTMIKTPGRVETILMNGEQLWDLTRQDHDVLLRWEVITILVLGADILILGASTAGLLVAVIALLPLAVRFTVWYNHIYGFSNLRVFEMRGVLYTKFRQTSYADLGHINYSISVYETILAFFRISFVPSGDLLLGVPKDDDDDAAHQALTVMKSVPQVVYHERRCDIMKRYWLQGR